MEGRRHDNNLIFLKNFLLIKKDVFKRRQSISIFHYNHKYFWLYCLIAFCGPYTKKRRRVQPYLIPGGGAGSSTIQSILGGGAGYSSIYTWRRSRVQPYLYLKEKHRSAISISGRRARYLEEEHGPTPAIPGRGAGSNPISTWKMSRFQPYLYLEEEQGPTLSIPGRGADSNNIYTWKRSRVQPQLYLEEEQGPNLSLPWGWSGSNTIYTWKWSRVQPWWFSWFLHLYRLTRFIRV